MGDPRGVGAEIIIKALDRVGDAASFVVYGDAEYLAAAAETAKIPQWNRQVRAIHAAGADGGKLLTEEGAGDASFRWAEAAAGCVLGLPGAAERADALVTAPISKAAWAAAGHNYPGHTELLGAMCGVPEGRFAMIFHAAAAEELPGLNVILTTVHVPLARVAELVTTERVLNTIRSAAAAMDDLGVKSARIGVCGLNPHAGEGGLLGGEDEQFIRPAVEAAKAEGLDVSGPFPADTIFRRALLGLERPADFDCVVAMYHDQGLVALKTMAMERAVNRTVGLPIIRTSPDHGTAFDLAGKNAADPRSMIEAVRLAVRLTRGRAAR